MPNQSFQRICGAPLRYAPQTAEFVIMPDEMENKQLKTKTGEQNMAFSDFKNIGEVQKKYNIKYKEEIFIEARETQPSEQFVSDFEFFKENIDVFSSEASRSEVVISPILREIYKKYHKAGPRHTFFNIKAKICFFNKKK